MKRKVLKSILCSVLIVALLSAPMSALAASKKVAYILKVYTTDSSKKVRVRSGSSLKNGNGSSDVIGTLKIGTKVLYWGDKAGQMLKIMTPGGKTGYIYQGNLKTYGAMQASQIYLTKSNTAVYKRSGSKMVRKGTVGADVPVVIYALKGDWAYVKGLTGASAYVKTSALKKAI